MTIKTLNGLRVGQEIHIKEHYTTNVYKILGFNKRKKQSVQIQKVANIQGNGTHRQVYGLPMDRTPNVVKWWSLGQPKISEAEIDKIKRYCQRLNKKLNKQFDLAVNLTFCKKKGGGSGWANVWKNRIHVGLGKTGWSIDWHGGYYDYQRIHPKIKGLGRYYPTGIKSAYYLIIHEFAHIIVGRLRWENGRLADPFGIDLNQNGLDFSSHGKIFQSVYNQLVDLCPYRKPATKKDTTKAPPKTDPKRPPAPQAGIIVIMAIKVEGHTLTTYSASQQSWGATLDVIAQIYGHLDYRVMV